MGEPNLQLLNFLSIAFDIRTFVETGSAYGETAQKALRIFPSVTTIELDERLFREAYGKVGGQAKCYHGKSVDVLRMVLPGMEKSPIVYWLDAHYSGGPTAGVEEQCPLLKEIEAINERDGNNDFIIIDDAHVFFSPVLLGGLDTHDVKQWPDLMQIFAMLNKKDRYTIVLVSYKCVEHGVRGGIVMPEDAIISVPNYAKAQLFSWLCSLDLERWDGAY